MQQERERLLRVTTSNAERRRIAAEVHDGAVQDLIGVAYTLEAVSRSDDTTPLAELATSTRDIVTRLRALLNSIYPVEVPPEGWAHGFDDLAEQLRAEGVEVNIDITSMPLGPTDEILLLRVTREALRNVARHAQAHRVEIMFARTGRGARLEIDDDGRGFGPLGTAAPGHIGLRLLDDLARDLGAELEVDAAPGQGTTIRLDLMERR